MWHRSGHADRPSQYSSRGFQVCHAGFSEALAVTPSPWSLSLTGSWRLTVGLSGGRPGATSGHGRTAGTGSSSESLASAQTALQRAVASPAEAVASEFPVTATVTVTESPQTTPDSEPVRVPVPVGEKPPTLPLPAARRLRAQLTGLANPSESPEGSSRPGPAAAPVPGPGVHPLSHSG